MNNRLSILLYILLGVLLAGLILWIASPPRGKPLTLQPLPTQGLLVVYLNGEVNHPGLYNLPRGSRVNDLILQAGGLKESADSNAINLAEQLRDGQKFTIPSKTLVGDKGTQNLSGSSENNPTPQAVININIASIEELDLLPDIGLAKAKQIVTYREEHGPFLTIEDIQNVPGIGEGVYNKIKELITTN
jgi:competence protein ComEA